ncbi:hypothetical protein PDJAM_G00128940 [Pangasius djambal]|uniref:Uncharacterized protein n=1 Tax=Pangasius djambal TaxID=1691987 RepID=A0ACC5ZCL2_9TELE|nr:hypothetical protein [Pangasius djambal]
MSDILCRWLNRELRLSKAVEPLSLAKDFSNGYLLGEVLHKHQLQQDFHQFSKHSTANAKLNNFTRLEPTLQLLGVPFDLGMAKAVMQGQQGAATRLLYQLYILLQKKTRLGLTGAVLETMQPAAVARLHRVEKHIYTERLRTMVKREADVKMQKIAQRFDKRGRDAFSRSKSPQTAPRTKFCQCEKSGIKVSECECCCDTRLKSTNRRTANSWDSYRYGSGDGETTANAKLNNFTRLEPTLQLLGVPFDLGMAKAVMQGQQGAATRLLYQLYILLQKKMRLGLTGAVLETMQPAAVARLHRVEKQIYTERLRTMVKREADVKMQKIAQRFDKRGRDAFSRSRLRTMVKREADVKMQKIAQRFDKRGRDAFSRSVIAELEREERRRHLQEQMRQQDLQKHRQARRKQQEIMDRIQTAVVQVPKPPVSRSVRATGKHRQHQQPGAQNIHDQISEFEKNRKRPSPASCPASVSVQVNEEQMEDWNNAYVQKIRKRLEEDATAREQREKRRRRALIQQLHTHQTHEEMLREEQLIGRLMRQSQQEKRIAVQLMQIRQQKEVLRQNRILRERDIHEQRLRDFQQALDQEAVNTGSSDSPQQETEQSEGAEPLSAPHTALGNALSTVEPDSLCPPVSLIRAENSQPGALHRDSKRASISSSSAAEAPPPEPGSSSWVYVDDELPKEMSENLLSHWENMCSSYVSNVKAVMQNLRKERNLIIHHLYNIREEYKQYLMRPDLKQEFVCVWQREYNSVSDDTRHEDETKSELHQRLEDLRERLWDICDKRREEAMQEKAALTEDSWLENHTSVLINHYCTLIQVEVDRFQYTLHLLRNYYAGMYRGAVPEAAPESTCLTLLDITDGNSNQPERTKSSAGSTPSERFTKSAGKKDPEIEDKKKPRVPSSTDSSKQKDYVHPDEKVLQDFHHTAVTAVTQLVTHMSWCTGAYSAGSTPSERFTKSAGKKDPEIEDKKKPRVPSSTDSSKQKDYVHPDEKVLQDFHHTAVTAVTQLVAAEQLEQEENKLQPQVERETADTQSHTPAPTTLSAKDKKKGGKKKGPPSPTQETILPPPPEEDAEEVQKKALAAIIRHHIESGSQITHELTLACSNLFIDRDTRVVVTPPPPPHPLPTEATNQGLLSLTVQQLYSLHSHLLNIAPTGLVSCGILCEVLTLCVGSDVLSEAWMRLTDSQDCGMVDWRQFLLSAARPWPLPSQTQLINTLAHFREIDTAGGGVITLQQCLQVELWFPTQRELPVPDDLTEPQPYDRLTHLRKRTLQVLLPYLAAKASPTASALIRTVAKQLNVNRREILISNFKYIFSHLVCSCTKDELERAFHYLKSETEIELGSLLRQDFQGLHNELLLRLGENYQQVFNGLSILASFASSDDPYQAPRDITSPEIMADYLQPKLLGILAFFNMQLLSSSAGEKEKKKMALNSLMALMKLMGSKHISSVRVKMMTTLRTGLRYKEDFPQLCCRTWDCFVHCLDPSYLGPLLSHVIVALLPLISVQPEETAVIMHYLIVENRQEVEDFLHEIYFLPDHPELKDVHKVLQDYRKQTSKSSDLQAALQLSMRAIQHENVDVRIHALTSLKEMLYKNQAAVLRLLLDSELVEPVLSELVTVLLLGCQDVNAEARLLCGECLGELGAIDPGRLDLSTTHTQRSGASFTSGIDDPEFAFGLLTELTRTFLAYADNVRAQDAAAYAMQELLSIFECREGRTDSPGRRLWRRFPEQVQEILEPHLNSRYKSSQKVVNWSRLTKPIYLSNRGSKFSDWSATWAGYLISKVRHDLASKVFNCCSFIIKHDYRVTLYLLPHILLYVLLSSTPEEQQEVVDEIMAVLKEDEPRLSQLQENASSLAQLSTQTVFSMLDHLTQWGRYRLQTLSTAKSAGRQNRDTQNLHANGEENSEYQCVVSFLNQIPQDVLAKASFRSKAYTRAVMHFEAFIREKQQNIEDHLSFLQALYAAMHEPDGVRGVNALRKEEPSLREQILEHESIGLLRESTACYDRAMQLEPDQIVHYHGVMSSMLGLGQLSTVMTQVNGVLANRPQWKSDLNAYRVEAAWKLSKWDLLEDYLASDEKSNTWGVRLGQMLLSAKKQDSEHFYEKLKLARREQVVPLSAASFECGTYQRGYEYIVRLHMLSELEHAFTELQKKSEGSKASELMLNWDDRLLMTQNSFRAKEPILALRRALLSLSKGCACEEQVGQCWLQSTRVARRAGHHQTAFNALLNAENSRLSELFVEKAKWLWSKGDVHQALIVLQKGVKQCFPEDQHLSDPKRIQIKGKALLLVGRYMEETANSESNAIMKIYRDVTTLLPEWEDGNFYLAKYYDKLMPMVTDNKMEKQGNVIRYIVTYFGKALQFGNQYIYQAMPRMLTLWLDFGAKVYEVEKGGRSDRAQMKADLSKINAVISEHTLHLSPYQFLTAFSQLISRICHSSDEVFAVLMDIIAKVFLAYPQQAMWMMTAVSKSSYKTRMNRCKEILNKAVSLNGSFGKFIGDANRLTDKLVELCNKPVDGNSSTLSMSVHFKMLKRLVEESSFSEILIPLQSVLIPTLPSTGGANASHDAFPGHWVYLSGFDDTVEILASLQKPKKISLKGSDGKCYTMMCKPKDDLRKDCRLMEFNCLINKCLRKDAESRRRDLHIRTYAVIPLNEECGIIEWVNNTAGLRHILTKLYKEKGIYLTGKELRKMILPKTASFQEKLKLHKDVLCARHLPVFHEWFLRTFPDPTSWYNSRSAYCRSTAVMSMVGYILGLGDRHGENILFDSQTGECVHVDFNCLFNKGETFDVPEVVPFRLTQNMVHAMGPMGTEGLFRQACEVTLRLMRDQREPLMSVLKTFLHDPLVEWSKPAKGPSKTQANESGEIVNEKAKTHVLDIDQRLQGVIKNRNKVMGLPLSIEGHVHYLIQEATDDNLLCLMYLGWGPYL